MLKEKIYLDNEGYKKLLKKLEDTKRQLKENNLGRKNAFDAGAGDGWDSPEFEEIERIERMLLGTLKKYYDELSRVVIIERTNNLDIVDIGDIVKVEMYFSEDDIETQIYKIVGSMPDFDLSNEIEEVSINSPLGASIYKKKVGESTSYLVNNQQIKVIIKEKLDLLNQKEDNGRNITK